MIVQLKCFALVFAILMIVFKIVEVAKILYFKEGKISGGKYVEIAYGIALSYIITCIIYGL